MAKKKEEVVEETTQQENPVKEEPKVDDKVEKIKVKKKPTMKKFSQDDEVFKVDLSKPVEETTEVVAEEIAPAREDEKKVETDGVEDTPEETETPVIEEVTDDEVEEITEQVEEAITEAQETGKELPENIQKLMDFMEDTGGDINDYVKLNRDYSKLENQDLLFEHYKQTKPHLNTEEINFLMEDQFSYDEEVDDERDIKRKKLALKEQVANAKTQLEENKSKYYEDIKAGSKLTSDQQKAVDFFNRYNKESEENNKIAETAKSNFLNKTDKVFNDKFKGFEYDVGDKKYRYNVNDINSVKENQSDINNFVGKFLDKNKTIEDAEGYHKSLYTAMNSDAVARHFYEQGKADALRDSVAKSKNIDMDPRQQLGNIADGSGIKVRALGENTQDFKFKIKNNKFKQ